MILTRLELINFKSHANKTVEFTAGVNTIFGGNFTGKTTIAEGILFCMFGVSCVSGGSKNITSRASSSKCVCTLSFLHEGVVHKITRHLKGAEVEKKVQSGDFEVVCRTSSEVSKYMQKILAMTKAQFLATKVSKQGEAHTLLATGSSEIKQLVEELSGCKHVDAMLTILKELQTEKETETKISRAVIEDFPSSSVLSGNMAALTTEINKVNELRDQDLTPRLHKAKQDQDTSSRELVDIKLSRADGDHLECKLQKLQNRTEFLQQSNKSLMELRQQSGNISYKDITTYKETLPEKQQQLKKYEEIAISVRQNQGDISRQQKILERYPTKQDEEEVQHLLIETQKTLDQCSLSRKLVQDQIVGIEKKIHTLDNKINKGVCDKCDRPFSDTTKEDVVSAQQERKELIQDKQELIETRQETDKKVNKLESDVTAQEHRVASIKQSNTQLTINIQNTTSELNYLEGKKQGLLGQKHHKSLEEINTLKEENNKLQSLISSYRDYDKEISGQQAQIDSNSKELITVSASLSYYATQKDVELIGQKHSNNKEVTSKLTQQLLVCQQEVNVKSKELQLVIGQSKKVSKHEAVISSATGYTQAIKRICALISKNRGKLLKGVWDSLLAETSTFVSASTTGTVSSISVDDKFNIVYTEEGHEMPLPSASGAQKSLIALGFRLAIGNILPSNADFMLLDEVSSDMSNEVSATALSTLTSLTKQCLLVSHRIEDQAFSDNIISTD